MERLIIQKKILGTPQSVFILPHDIRVEMVYFPFICSLTLIRTMALILGLSRQLLMNSTLILPALISLSSPWSDQQLEILLLLCFCIRVFVVHLYSYLCICCVFVLGMDGKPDKGLCFLLQRTQCTRHGQHHDQPRKKEMELFSREKSPTFSKMSRSELTVRSPLRTTSKTFMLGALKYTSLIFSTRRQSPSPST